MSDDTTTFVETTTTTVERTVPDSEITPTIEESGVSQAILDRLDAMSERLDKLETPAVTIENTTVEEPDETETGPPGEDPGYTTPESEPTEVPADEPATDVPDETRTDDPDADREDIAPVVPDPVPDPDKPYQGRPEIENPDPYASAAPKKRRKDRAPSTPRSWRTAILGGSGGVRSGSR